MARGATKTAEDTAQQIGISGIGAQKTAADTASSSLGTLMPQIQQMLSPGGDPAVTAATMGGLGSRFGAAKQDVMDTAARTRNAASTNASIDDLARSEGAEGAQAAANNVMNQKKTADDLLAKIYGTSSGQVPELLNARTNANNSYIAGAKTGNSLLQTLIKGAQNAVGGAAGAVTG